jgi:hypothetical protein
MRVSFPGSGKTSGAGRIRIGGREEACLHPDTFCRGEDSQHGAAISIPFA